MNIVNVAFEDRRNPGTFGGCSYSYLSDQPVSVGDLVNVPTKYGQREAMIVKTDVPIRELQCRVGQLKRITGPAISGGDLFAGFFN